MSSPTPQTRVGQLCQELRYLWRPEDRLLGYVQVRLVELATLGVQDPWATRPHS